MRTIASALAVLALSGCVSGRFDDTRYQEQSHKTLPAAGIKVLHVDDAVGRVRVEAWNQSDVRVDVTKRGPDPRALDAIRVTIARNGDTIDITSDYGDRTSRSNVDFVIKAPPTLSLQLSNVAGTMRVIGCTGDISARTQAGTIDVSMPKLGGDQRIDLSATTGTVALTVPKNSDATVSAHSTIGTFRSDFPGVSTSREMLVGERGGGTIGSGSAKVSLTTTTGTIELNTL